MDILTYRIKGADGVLSNHVKTIVGELAWDSGHKIGLFASLSGLKNFKAHVIEKSLILSHKKLESCADEHGCGWHRLIEVMK